MTDARREVRNVLLGYTYLTEDGKIAVRQKGQMYLSYGVADGAGAVRFLGMAEKSVAYSSRSTPKNVMKEAARSMRDIGRGVELAEQPDAVACIIRFVLTKPALMSFRYVGDVPVLTVWAPRTPMGFLSLFRAVRAFEKELPDFISRSETSAPEDPLFHEEKKEKKKKRKDSRDAQGEGQETAGETPETEGEKTDATAEGQQEDIKE